MLIPPNFWRGQTYLHIWYFNDAGSKPISVLTT